MKHYTGHCHCRALSFDFSTQRAMSDWALRACQCTFCRAHGALCTSDPAGELSFGSPRRERLQRYRFAMRTADFLVCADCGVYIGAVIQTAGGKFGIVNLRALDKPLVSHAAEVPVSYDQEEEGDRILRRETRWTPIVSVSW